ncbi:hypothetical protein [Romboutsia sp. 1001713B170207_170306_H8]|nr:hypothetical protein [Romboutsia sp. 1001713B170207_170306_H8]
MCDNMFEEIWNNKNNLVIDNKDEIIDIIIEFLGYTKIINKKLYQ